MNTPKIAFVDIDWTLYDHEHACFNKKGIEALKLLQKKGCLVFLNSARSYHSIKHLGTFKVFKPDGIVASNGASVFYKNKVIESSYFTDSQLQGIIDLANKFHNSLELTCDKKRFMVTPTYKEVALLFSTYKEVTVGYKKYKGQKANTCLLFADNTNDEYFIKHLPKGVTFYRYDTYGVDLDPHPMSKGDGVKVALNYLGIDKKDALAIGDDYQDLDMFKECGTSIALGNGREEVKKAADYVADTISQDGLYNLLKQLEII